MAIPTGTDRWQLVLTHRMRKLHSRLTLRTPRGRHRVVERTTITLT